MNDVLPNSVRYVKNGRGGRWWESARTNNELHAGWPEVPVELLRAADLAKIEPWVRSPPGGKAGTTQDFKALCTLLDRPSQHIWVTFQGGRMWWCTVLDEVRTNPGAASENLGHFWLNCARPWSDWSVDGLRRLEKSELPGNVTAVAGFRATVCKPGASAEILRIIRNEVDQDAHLATLARRAYEDAVRRLVARLDPKDFEILIDLILSRTGWARLAKIGGVRADIDIEVENAALDEIAFVQVKSSASQATLSKCISDFEAQSGRYARMIFAVHSPDGELTPRRTRWPVQVWAGDRIAELVVRHGLGDWVAKRL